MDRAEELVCTDWGLVEGLVQQSRAIGELKRLRTADYDNSLAGRLFTQAWCSLCAENLAEVVDATTAAALVSTQLGWVDAKRLASLGLDAAASSAIMRRAFAAAMIDVPRALARRLEQSLAVEFGPAPPVPAFVGQLLRQPRAGATAPGKPRLVLEPAESHAEHCLCVAVIGVLASSAFDADPATVFLAGLAHHLHNARLPDSGFAGEVLLGEELAPLMRRLLDAELATLPASLAERVRAALAATVDATTREGRAFHTADVFDRVLQMQHYEEVARVRAEHALQEMDLVHAGPVQAFHLAMLRQGGLL